MKPAHILGCGAVDEVGITGTRGIVATWQELDMVAPGTARTVREVFDKADPTFRRIDHLARALVLACEAADLENLLSPEQRQETAICIETDLGALATDLSFASSLGDECVHAGIFPYSLTSTSLGEVALRYKLRGTTISMSVRKEGTGANSEVEQHGQNEAGESLREALRMLACGDCKHVLTGVVDTLIEATSDRPATMNAIVAIVTSEKDPRALGTLAWPDGAGDPFQQFVTMCR